MTLTNYEIKPLFAEPIFRVNIGHAISDDQIAYIKNLKMVQNRVNLISENLYIFEDSQLRSIKDAVDEALDIYASEVMGIDQKLYVTQSWSLVNYPEVGMHGHSHSNSIVSGSLYYCDLPTPVARMFFDRHNSYQRLDFKPSKEKLNIFNAPINTVTPKKGELVLFASGLQHVVEPNGSSEPRFSIAFNTFVKGKLGDYRDVSELELQ